MKTCPTLDKALSGQGYPLSTPTAADAKRSCATQKKTADEVIGVTLSLQAGQTINENIADPSKASTGTVNDRPAVQEREPIGAKRQCAIMMEVKPESRAAVSVTLSYGTTDQACVDVNDIATRVEPLLPRP
jgi:outer membrane protein assembly factor BamA